VNATVGASSPATFTVAVSASSVLGTNTAFQWQRAEPGSSTFTDITGANGNSYTLSFPTSADTGAKFRAVASITFDDPALGTSATATSQAATLTVSSDTIPPVVTGVGVGVKQIVVFFNEPLDTTSAETAANYKVSGGVNATAAKVTSGAGAAGVVAVTISGATPGATYAVTVTGVKDTAGNPVASTTKTFEAFHINSDFNDGGVPLGAAVAGSANVQASGGPDGSGFLELTTNVGSLTGVIVYDDVLGGEPVTQFTAQFKLYIGNGSGNPADGFSFCLGSDLAADPTVPTSFNEEGTGSGLIVVFDTYDSGGGEAPAISVKFAGNEFAKTNVSKATLVNNRWVDVLIRVNADGTIDVFHDNIKYFEKLPIDGWAPIAGAQLGMSGRTGGEYERHWVDSLKVVYNADMAVNEAPTVAITSPADGAKLTVGASAAIQVNAQDKENQIAKVEFFVNGSKIGESTTAPYSFTIPSVAQGAYLIYAKVSDVPGLSTVSPTIKVVAGNPDKILFVTVDPGPLTYAADQAVYQRLVTRGYDVQLTTGTAVPDDGSTASGNVLVIVSSSLGSGSVVAAAGGAKFLNTTIPVMVWEYGLLDDFRFQPAAGTSTADQTQVNIVNASHPLAAGFPAGLLTVTTSPQVFSQGTPINARIIATLATDINQAIIFCYEKGDVGDQGFAQPARRAFFYFQNNTAAAVNTDGWKLFDAEVDWLLGKSTVTTPPTITVTRNNTQITLTWQGSGTLQSTTSLTPPIIWNNVGASPQTINNPTGASYFRVKQ
jgi:hypothetical protein